MLCVYVVGNSDTGAGSSYCPCECDRAQCMSTLQLPGGSHGAVLGTVSAVLRPAAQRACAPHRYTPPLVPSVSR